MRIQFGECTFDPVRREVRRAGEPVRLSPKAFELLRLLVESRPHALGKDVLFGSLWPDTFVSDASLAGLVAEIRREIGEDAREPRFVRTVHGFGYAFSDGTTNLADEGSVFRIICRAREGPLAEGENVLGRDLSAAVASDSATVSRHHARIVIQGSRAALEDLGSKNGTWLKGGRIETSEPLSDGDEIRVGPVALVFRSFPAGSSTETQIE